MPSERQGRRSSALTLLVALILSSQAGIIAVTNAQSGNSASLPPQSSTAFPSYLSDVTTFGSGLSGAPTILTEANLDAMAGGSESVQAYGAAIRSYMVPAAVKVVLLDIGWYTQANTTTTLVAGGYKQWVANWLNASGSYGIETIFFTRQWGYFFSGPSWDQSFLNAHPQAKTANASGVYVPLKSCAGCVTSSAWSVASSYVYAQYAEDLKQLYQWYGKYAGWVGFGEGATGDRNYYSYAGNSVNPNRPFDNSTLQAYANSAFFRSEVDKNGVYLGTSVVSKIWQAFVAHTASYGTAQFYGEIASYGANSYSGGSLAQPLRGWNAFLDYQQASINYNLTQMMSLLSGRVFYWYTGLQSGLMRPIPGFDPSYVLISDPGAGGPIGCPPTKASCGGYPGYWGSDTRTKLLDKLAWSSQDNWIGWSSFGSTQDNLGSLTPSDLRNFYLYEAPLLAGNPLTINDWAWGVQFHGLNNMTQTRLINAFGSTLGRMSYTGGYFGTERSAVRVLWIGTPSDEGIFPQFLTTSVDLTYVNGQDGNLTAYRNLQQFNVIVNLPSSPTSSFLSRLTAFIGGGGGLVETQFGADPGVQDVFLGLASSSTAVSTSSTLTILTPNKITSPYTSISYDPYWVRYSISPIPGESPRILVADSKGNPVIATNQYQAGRAVLVEQPYARLSSVGSGSPGDSYVSLVINSIFYAAHLEGMLPILWYGSYTGSTQWAPQIQYSILGSPGAPVLLWLSNNGTGSFKLDVHLNGTFYGLGPNWVALDARDMSVVANGTTSDIHVSATVPAKAWLPVYLLPVPTQAGPIYSTDGVTGVSASNSEIQTSTNGHRGTSSWLVVYLPASPSSVSSSSQSAALPQYASQSALNGTKIGTYCTAVLNGGTCSSFSNYDQEGWYYDAQDSLLFVHYASSASGAITVFTQSTSTASSTSSSAWTTTTAATSTTSSTTTASVTTASATITSATTTSYTSASLSTTTTESSTTQHSASTTYSSSSTSVSTTGSGPSPPGNSSGSDSTAQNSQAKGSSYSVNFNPSRVSVYQGSNAPVMIHVNSSADSLGAVKVEVAGVPAGVNASIQSAGGHHVFTALLTVSASSDALPGAYILAVKFVSQAGNYSVDLPLTVLQPVHSPHDATVQVEDFFGIPVGGAAVTVQFADGSALTQTTNGTGFTTFKNVTAGPFNVTVAYMGVSSVYSGNSVTNPAVLATAGMSQSVAIAAFALAGTLAGAGAIHRLHRRKSRRGFAGYPEFSFSD